MNEIGEDILTVERTMDFALVRSIVTHPLLYSLVSDDSTPVESYQPSEDPRIIYLLASGTGPMGVFMLVPESGVCWEIHTCLLPSVWGPVARRIAKLAESWIWKNITCERLITKVPECNQQALKFTLASGMLIYGFNPGCFQRNGHLWGEYLLGMTRPV
jgi:hypothetical protein